MQSLPSSRTIVIRRTQDSSVGIATGYEIDDRGFDSRRELGILLFYTVSIPAPGPTQPLLPGGKVDGV
jgi:hypothetical protein